MKGERAKWLFTFTLLAATIGWAVFSRVFSSTESDIVTGALIAWTALVIQYWFRKKTPDEPPNG